MKNQDYTVATALEKRKQSKQKPFFAAFLSTILIVSFFTACGTKNETINDYRKGRNQEIQQYSISKLQSDYSEENRNAVNEIVSECKNTINKSNDKEKIDTAVLNAKQALDNIEPLQSDELQEGAYFITEIGYEWYTKTYFHPNNIIEKMRSLWVLIKNGQMTVSVRDRTAYELNENNGIYRGVSPVSFVDIWLSNDILYIRNGKNTLQYSIDSTYDVSTIAQTKQLATPSDITITDKQNYVSLMWAFSPNYGYFGAAVEIKNADNDDFTPIKIERPYMNTMVAQLFLNNYLRQGENLIRIYNIGGYWINTSKTVSLSEKSDYVTFKVTVTDNTIITVQL